MNASRHLNGPHKICSKAVWDLGSDMAPLNQNNKDRKSIGVVAQLAIRQDYIEKISMAEIK